MTELLPEMMINWLLQYGSLAVFCLLALGIIALPVPEETLLVFSGILISQGILSPFPTFFAALLGSITGITVSFIIGYHGGHFVIKKYGKYIWLNESKMAIAHEWFEHYGKWMLFIGYFVPGLRHFTGIFAGVSELEYPHFALFAYTGALFWVTLFLSIGYFFGNCCDSIFQMIERHVETLGIVALVGILFYIGYKVWKNSGKT